MNVIKGLKELEIPRRLMHACGSIIPIYYWLMDCSKVTMLKIALPITFIAVAADIFRLINPTYRQWFNKHLGILLREDETHSSLKSSHYMISIALILLFFNQTTAIVSILFLALSDPLSGFAGNLIQTPKIFRKPVFASIVHFLSCVCIGSFFLPLPHTLVCAALATTVDAFPLPIDDNLTVPLASAVTLSFLLR